MGLLIGIGRDRDEWPNRSERSRVGASSCSRGDEPLRQPDVRVVLFAPPGDHHAEAVERALDRRSTGVARIDLSSVAGRVSIDPGRSLEVDDVILRPGVSVWWRRTGTVPTDPGLTDLENRLRTEECEALLLGGLLALTDRWVDDPFVVMSAEHSLKQLAVARSLGVAVPTTIATNDPRRAEALHMANGPLIAKATSAGVGIAPYADFVDPELFTLLGPCITLLQQAQRARADLRVVTVGNQAFAWMRPRLADEPLDWRAVDPVGREFAPFESEALSQAAVSISHRMGLRFSVQDWLLVDDELVFLEVNPSGQWLFLAGADELISNALGALLAGEAES